MRQKTLLSFLGQSEVENNYWKEDGSIMIFDRLEHGKFSDKNPIHIAAFDLDETLITTASKRKFGKDANDWKFLMPKVPKSLAQLYNEEGYIIVIFTNQLGIGLDISERRKIMFQEKINSLFEKVKIPMLLLAALAQDVNRKPCIGMWEFFKRNYIKSFEINLERSFFVGDAAGRPAGWRLGQHRGADHASTDRKFALNLGIPFLTPDEFFGGESRTSHLLLDTFNPKTFLPHNSETMIMDSIITPNRGGKGEQQAVILIGSPASGKSTFYQRYFHPFDYTLISQDALRTRAKCLVAFRDVLLNGKSLVLDNTNPTVESRRPFLQCALELKVKVLCFWLQSEPPLTRHLNVHRSITRNVPRLPEVAFIAFESKFQEPTLSEGYTKVIKVPFVPKFDTTLEEETFLLHLV